jgi:hypothetical protein
MIAVVAAKNHEDVNNLEILQQTFPRCLPLMMDTGDHNVTGYFYRASLLRLFYASLFEYWNRPVSVSELIPMLDEIARENAFSPKRIKQPRTKVEAVEQYVRRLVAAYTSSSWRRTKPGRVLTRVTKQFLVSRGLLQLPPE